jgi:hypothetical protein
MAMAFLAASSHLHPAGYLDHPSGTHTLNHRYMEWNSMSPSLWSLLFGYIFPQRSFVDDLHATGYLNRPSSTYTFDHQSSG